LLDKRLEDLDYRIAQYRRERQHEQRLVRRRKALLASHAATHDQLEHMAGVLEAEEAKLERGSLFHTGMERRMVEDIIAVENLAVFKAAVNFDVLRERLEDLEAEVQEINGELERHRDHHDQEAMLEEWRNEVYDRADRGTQDRNALLHRRLDVWLEVADREDDLEDLSQASRILEDALMALEASIHAGTKVQMVQKRDLAVLANLQPARTKQFLLLEMVRKAKEAYRYINVLIDVLQGIEHLKVHVREPVSILEAISEAMLLDFYEGDRPYHALREVHENHMYLKQIRDGLAQRKKDVGLEIDDLKEREDELLLMAVDRRLKQRSMAKRWHRA
jgi:hypothetical protein